MEIQSLPSFLYALVESSQLQLQFSKSKHPCSVRGELKLGLYRDGARSFPNPQSDIIVDIQSKVIATEYVEGF